VEGHLGRECIVLFRAVDGRTTEPNTTFVAVHAGVRGWTARIGQAKPIRNTIGKTAEECLAGESGIDNRLSGEAIRCR